MIASKSKKAVWSAADADGTKSLCGRVVIDRFRGNKKLSPKLQLGPSAAAAAGSAVIWVHNRDRGRSPAADCAATQGMPKELALAAKLGEVQPAPAASTRVPLQNPYLNTVPHNEIHTIGAAQSASRASRKVH